MDAAFRRSLLTDPRSALQKELDLELPGDFKIRFVENEGADLTVILPDLELPDIELSDENLVRIFGGAAPDRLISVRSWLHETGIDSTGPRTSFDDGDYLKMKAATIAR
jgi:hypothetical protein